MTGQDKAFDIIKRIRRTNETDERTAIKLALITVDEINGLLFELQPSVDENLWLYREIKGQTSYWIGVENVLKKMNY